MIAAMPVLYARGRRTVKCGGCGAVCSGATAAVLSHSDMPQSLNTLTNTRIVIGPNASLSPRQAAWFMALMASVSLAIAGFFAAQGLWPILPFAGLELAALGTALWVVLHRNRYREVLSFTEETIRIEIGMVGQGVPTTIELCRSRTRVLLEAGPHRNSPNRLLLSDAGRRLVIARCLTDEERERIAARVRELIHPGWRGPPAGADAPKAASAAWW